MAEAAEPLLEAYWADAASVPHTAPTTRICCPTITEIQERYPNQLIKYLRQNGLRKLGEARIPASELQRLFKERPFVARGSAHRSLCWKREWNIDPLPDEAARKEEEFILAIADGDDEPARAEGAGAGNEGGHNLWGQLRERLPAIQAVTPPRPPPKTTTPSVIVESYLIAVRNAAATGERGVLGPMLRRWHYGSCTSSAFGLPVVQAVVSYKWDRFAQRLLLLQLGAYLLWVGSFTAFMLLFNAGDAQLDDAQLVSTWKGIAAVCSQLLSLVAMAPFLASEVLVFASYGLRGWLSAWNLLDGTTYTLQIAITALHLGQFPHGPRLLTGAVSAQAVLLIVRLTYFSRVFNRSTSFDFMGSLTGVMRDVGWYIAVLLLMMWGFAGAFFTTFKDDPAADGFESLPLALLSMLNYAVGGASFSSDGLLASAAPTAALVLCTVYQFLVSMVLMSLLTGIMANALMRASSQEAVTLVLNRAQVIDELERVLPPFLLRMVSAREVDNPASTTNRTTTASGAPYQRCDTSPALPYDIELPYVHVLRVNPKSLEQIDGEERLWPQGLDGDNGGGGGVEVPEPSAADVAAAEAAANAASRASAAAEATESLAAQVAALRGQLEEVGALVRQMAAERAGGAAGAGSADKGRKGSK